MTALDEPGRDRRERRAIAWMFGVCGVLFAGGLAIGIDRYPLETPVQLGNVTDAEVVEIRDDGGAPVLTGEFRSRRDAVGNTEKDAGLVDRKGRRVIGEIEIEIPADGRLHRRPELEVDVIGLEPSSTYSVFIDDREVGRFTTDDRGSVDMELQEGELPGSSSLLPQ